MKTLAQLVLVLVISTLFYRAMPTEGNRRFAEEMGLHFHSAEKNGHSLLVAEKKNQGQYKVLLVVAKQKGATVSALFIISEKGKAPYRLTFLIRGKTAEEIMSIDSLDVQQEDDEITEIIGYSNGKEVLSYNFEKFWPPDVA